MTIITIDGGAAHGLAFQGTRGLINCAKTLDALCSVMQHGNAQLPHIRAIVVEAQYQGLVRGSRRRTPVKHLLTLGNTAGTLAGRAAERFADADGPPPIYWVLPQFWRGLLSPTWETIPKPMLHNLAWRDLPERHALPMLRDLSEDEADACLMQVAVQRYLRRPDALTRTGRFRDKRFRRGIV